MKILNLKLLNFRNYEKLELEFNPSKNIIIGKNGQMLKKIGTYAREDLEKMLDVKVNLQLWVKVREDWQNDTSLLKKFKLQ